MTIHEHDGENWYEHPNANFFQMKMSDTIREMHRTPLSWYEHPNANFFQMKMSDTIREMHRTPLISTIVKCVIQIPFVS